MYKNYFFKIVVPIVLTIIPMHVYSQEFDKPSATIEIMKKSPPMSAVQNTNLLYTEGINGKYPKINDFKKQHEEKASRLIAIIKMLGESLDEMKVANDSFDKNINLQFLRWHSLSSKNKKFNPILVEEEKLMKKSMDFQIKNAIYWSVINTFRKELNKTIKNSDKTPNHSLVQSHLYIELLKLYFVLTDFYSEKQKTLFISATCLHSFEENKNYNLPSSALSKVNSLHEDELELINFMIYKLVDIWELAFDALSKLDQLNSIDNKIIFTAKEELLEQYIHLKSAVRELENNGLQDEVDLIKGILESYKTILSSSNEISKTKNNSFFLSTNKINHFLATLHFTKVAHAGVLDWIKSKASAVSEGVSIAADTIIGTAKDVVNLPVEAWDKTTKGVANIYYGNEKISAKSFIDGVKDSYSKVGTNKLGQDAMDKAQGSFKEFDKEYINKVPLGQALANVATFGGYGLAKDVVTLNDGKASFTDKVVAGVGVGLSFLPLQAPAGNVATGTLGGAKEATKTGFKAGVKISSNAMNYLGKKGLNDIAKKEAYLASKALIKAQSAKAGKGVLWQLEKTLFSASGKIAPSLTNLLKAQKNLNQSIKNGLKSTANSFFNGFKKGFVGESKTAVKALVNAAKGNWGKSVTEGLKEIIEGGVKKYIIQGVTTEVTGDYIKSVVKDILDVKPKPNESILQKTAQNDQSKSEDTTVSQKTKDGQPPEPQPGPDTPYDPRKDPNLQTGDTQVAKDITDQVSKFQTQQPGPQKDDSGSIGGGDYPTDQSDSYTKGSIGKPTPPAQADDDQKDDGVKTAAVQPDDQGTGGLSDVTVDRQNITMTFWDHGVEDGDIINIYLNGKSIKRGIRLKKSKRSFPVQLNSGKNRFEVEAVNEGTISPNTASVRISNVTSGKALQIYERKSGQKASMRLTAP